MERNATISFSDVGGQQPGKINPVLSEAHNGGDEDAITRLLQNQKRSSPGPFVDDRLSLQELDTK